MPLMVQTAAKAKFAAKPDNRRATTNRNLLQTRGCNMQPSAMRHGIAAAEAAAQSYQTPAVNVMQPFPNVLSPLVCFLAGPPLQPLLDMLFGDITACVPWWHSK